jgi:hypothetical protein
MDRDVMQMINEVGKENDPTALYVTFFVITLAYLGAKFFVLQKNTLKYVSKEKKWVYTPGVSIWLSIGYLITIIIAEIIILITVNLQKHCGGYISNRNAFSVMMKSLTNWGIIFSTTFITVNFLPGIHWKAPFSNTFGYEIASRLYGANDYETFFKKLLKNPNDSDLKTVESGKYKNNLVEVLNLLLDKSLKNLRPFINGITLEDFTQFINISIYEKIINDVGDDAIAQAEKARDQKINNTGESPAAAEEADAPTGENPAEEADAPTGENPAEEADAPTGENPAEEADAPTGENPAEEADAPTGENPAKGAAAPTGENPAKGAAAPTGENPAKGADPEGDKRKPPVGGKRKKKNQRSVKKGGSEQEDSMNKILDSLRSQQNELKKKMDSQKSLIDKLTAQQNRYAKQMDELSKNTKGVTDMQAKRKENKQKMVKLQEDMNKNAEELSKNEKELADNITNENKIQEQIVELSPEDQKLIEMTNEEVIKDAETDTTSGDDEDFDQEQLKDDEIYKLTMKLFKIICLKELMGEFMWISLAGMLTILLNYTSVLEEKCIGKGNSVFSNMSQMVGEFGKETSDMLGISSEAEDNTTEFEQAIQDTEEAQQGGTANYQSIDDNFTQSESFTLLKETENKKKEREEIESQGNRSFYKIMQDNTFWKGVKDNSSLELGSYNSNNFNKEARDIKKRIKTQGVPFLSQQFDL